MRCTPSLFVLLGSLATSHSWVLDASCQPYREMVKTSMNSAFDMARAGEDVLDAVDPYGIGTPSQAQSDLVSYLFADALSNGQVNDAPFRKARRMHESILGYDSNLGEPNPRPPQDLTTLRYSDVVVFCNYDRFTENRDCDGNEAKGMACDTSMRHLFQMGDIYKECKNKPFGGGGTEAWTKVMSRNRVGKASIIQLCPWYLEKVKGQKFKTFADLGNKPFPARKFTDKLLGNTAMDLVNLFDGTLLHELAHAPPDIAAVDGDGDDSYRWKNCRRLAKKGTTNAETYSFFGLGAKMISSKDNPQRPMEDGSIQVLPANAKKRRSDTLLVNRAAAPEVTTTVNHDPITLEPSDAASLTDAIPAGESSAVIYDVHTIFLNPGGDDSSPGSPGSSASETSQSTSTASTSGRPGSGTPGSSPSTFMTSPSVSESSGGSSTEASSPVPSPSGSSALSPAVSSGSLTDTSSTSSGPLVDSTSGSPPDSTSTDSTSSGPLVSSTSADPTSSGSTSSGPLVGSTSYGSTSGSVSSGLSSSSSATFVVVTTSDGTPVTSTVVAESTPAPTSITSAPESSDVTTVTSGSSTTTVPITVVDVTKSDTTTPVTYTSTQTSAEDGKPTDVWACTGPLCDSSSGCKIPAFCNSPDLGTSWGLCCGFAPAPGPDGTVPPPGGPPAPPPAPPGEEGPPDNSDDNQSESTTSTSSSTSESSSTTTSTSSEPTVADTITGDQFLEAEPVTTWYEAQQSLLSELMADTTDPYITWTPSTSSSGSLGSPTSTPLITSSSSPSTVPSTSAETTSSTTDTTSASPTSGNSGCSIAFQGDMGVLSCPSTTRSSSTTTSSTSTSSASGSSGCSVTFHGDMGVLSCPSTTSSSTTSTSSASSIVLSGSPTSSGTATPVETSTSSASPTPSEDPGTADCKIIFKDELSSVKDWMYKVTMSGDWVDEQSVKTEVSTCSNEGGQPSAWVWEDQGDGFYMAGFDLYDLSDEDCVANAIRSASAFNVEDVTCNEYIGEDQELMAELTEQSS